MPNLPTGPDCCGCTACMAICPKSAITMQADGLGFKYPKVDKDKCIECKACERVCSFNDNYDTSLNFKTPIPYGVRLKNMEEVMRSRSGGAFIAFSDWVLNKNGVVYGAGYKDHFVVAHKRATTPFERNEFRGSKYVQSELGDTFKSVKEDLSNGKWVLFSGTPCQVAGLKSFIPRKLWNKLVTVDIVCHGVPSPSFWKDYIAYIEKKENGEILKVNFRDKIKFGWKAHKESFVIEDKNTGNIKEVASSAFTYIFYQHVMQRPSCANCHYCNLRRPSDLTLADFWGWERTGNTINNDDKGLSLALVNSELGKQIFDEVEDGFISFKVNINDCMQPCLESPFENGIKSEQFRKDYRNHGFGYVFSRFGNEGWRYEIKLLRQRILNKVRRALRLK